MKYIITKHTIADNPVIEILPDEYELCKKAKEDIFEALHMEEKLNIVIENFRDYEMAMLNITMNHTIYRDVSWTSFNDDRILINRKLANLLTACRLYLDHLFHHLKIIFGESSDYLNDVRKEISKHYDAEVGYRIMEALRNYVQHRGFAINKLTRDSGWNKERTFISNSLIPYVSVLDLEMDGEFKKSVLLEMKKIGNDIDIRPLIRTYVASISLIQEFVRGVVSGHAKNWEERICNMIDKYTTDEKDKEHIGLVVAIMDDNGCYDNVVYIFKDFIRTWKRLEHLNSNIKYIPNHRISN